MGAAPRWLRLRQRYHRLHERLTRAFPNEQHNDFVHVFATLIHPDLVEAEARMWRASFTRSKADMQARIRRHTHPRHLVFDVEFSNHIWPWNDQGIQTILWAARLEVDGRFFPVHAVERSFFGKMLRGQTRSLVFKTPEGELALPGPSAKVVRLWFHGLENKRRRGARVRRKRKDRWYVPRISFPPEMFQEDWLHSLEI